MYYIFKLIHIIYNLIILYNYCYSKKMQIRYIKVTYSIVSLLFNVSILERSRQLPLRPKIKKKV